MAKAATVWTQEERKQVAEVLAKLPDGSAKVRLNAAQATLPNHRKINVTTERVAAAIVDGLVSPHPHPPKPGFFDGIELPPLKQILESPSLRLGLADGLRKIAASCEKKAQKQ